MIILIDGYNVLKQVQPNKQVTEAQRQQFVAQLRSYGKRKNHKIVLVFDAGPFDRTTKEHLEGVLLVYSGVRESADDYVRAYMTQHKDQDIMLITSDRALRNHAYALKMQSLPALEFYQLLIMSLRESVSVSSQYQEVIKTSVQEDQELDDLMMSTKQVPHKSEDFVSGRERSSGAPKISKHEREVLRKIKKL